MPLGWFPKRLGKPYIVPSYIKPLSIIDYKVEEDNLWNACQFSAAVILSYRGRWFWETLNLSWERINLKRETLLLKRCFSVNANLLQGIWESGLAVGKLSKMVAKFGKTVAYTSKSHIFYPEKYDFLSLKVILFVCLATELQILPTVSPVLSLT